MVGVLDMVSKRRFLSCRFARRDELEKRQWWAMDAQRKVMSELLRAKQFSLEG